MLGSAPRAGHDHTSLVECVGLQVPDPGEIPAGDMLHVIVCGPASGSRGRKIDPKRAANGMALGIGNMVPSCCSANNSPYLNMRGLLSGIDRCACYDTTCGVIT